MTFEELKEISNSHSYCLFWDKIFPRNLRKILQGSVLVLAIVTLTSFISPFESLPLYFGFADGVFLLCVFVFLLLSFLEFFCRSMKSEGLYITTDDKLLKTNKNIDYALSSILLDTDEIDVTKAFFETKIGAEVLIRSGVSKSAFKNFLYSDRSSIITSSLNFDENSVDLADYAGIVYDTDKSFQSFLSHNSVKREDFISSASWVMDMKNKKRRKERFWSRENLGTIPSLGTSWFYGELNSLSKFGILFDRTINISALNIEDGYRQREVSLLEDIMERQEKASAIIIDDDEKVVRDTIGRFLKKIKLGIVQPYIEGKNIIELDWSALVATYKNKNDLEGEILKIFDQSISTGNIILYIKDLFGFVSSAKNSGVNLPSLLSSYLSSAELPIIASVTNSDFHFFVEIAPALLEKFGRIVPTQSGVPAVVCALLEQIPHFEKQYKIYFSYPSVFSLVKSADRYVTYGEMPSKAINLLSEITPWAVENGIEVLKESDVSAFISRKANINTGAIKADEVNKIKNLEKLLRKRVVGQEEAVKAVTDTIKRIRTNITNLNRPLASFLFIGPTGVGKTEVSKVLAESFFGDENKIIRFDMSEYSGPDAVTHLIGDFFVGKSGPLAIKIVENPYSVLLLDEFEKAAPDVLDLFLQILDEGVFTDALGNQINCRNLIIVATSNAGSELIWKLIKSKVDLTKSKSSVIDVIIKNKVFRSELLNRFDEIILFHPLHKREMSVIARFGLQNLARKLKEQDFELVINDELIDFLVEKSGNMQFGGHSINHIIQNEIGRLIAKKIAKKEVKPGSKIEIKKEELL
jgi:ATP-dependent Clp protease ATP-binding subunit ClpC